MAQFNQLQTSASQVLNPPAGYVSFHFDDKKKLKFFDSTGPLTITASIMAESASVAETANRFTAGTKVITGSLIVNGNLQAQSFTLSSSVISSLVLTNSGSSTFGNDLADQHKFSGSFSVTGSALIKGNTIITGSTINNGNFSVVNGAISGSLISGSSATITEVSASSISILTASINNLTIVGTASIKYLNVDYQSSSVIFSSGSNIFGDAQNDVQQFTGSVGISGSTFSVNTTGAVPEFRVTGTGTKKGNTLTDSHEITGSVEITGSTFRVLTTGTNPEFQVLGNGVRLGNVLTDSHQVTGSVEITGSAFRVLSAGTNPEFQVLGNGTRLGNLITDTHELTGSFRITGSTLSIGNIGIVSGSGSFSGSGANLYDISASAIVGLNLARISTGSFSASMYVVGATGSNPGTGSFHINAPIYVTSSTTGSNIYGTSSWAMDAVFGGAVVTVSGSYPTSQRNVNTGSASGSLWWNTEDGNLYIQAAGPSGSTWVPAVSSVADGTFGATYTDVETVAALTWSIDHGLNTLTPIVQVYTGSQVMVPASIRSVNVNRTEITFATATAGTAILSTGIGGPTSASFAATSNLAVTASYLDGELPTVIFARNSSGQSIPTNTIPTTIMTGWTNTIAQNASEWNRTTGVFTATKFGTYSVSAAATYGPIVGTVGQQYNIAIVKNGVDQSIVLRFVEEATSISRATGVVSAIVSLSPGDTMTVNLYHVLGSSRALVASLSQNFLNIEEIPRIIQR